MIFFFLNARRQVNERIKLRDDLTAAEDLSSEVLEDAFLADTVLEAELLPELHPDLVPALPHLQSDDFSRHFPLLPSERESRDWERK